MSLILITGFFFVLSDYDVLNPVFILSALMTFSVFLATLSQSRWNLYMSIDASLVVLAMVGSFGVSGLWAHKKLSIANEVKNFNYKNINAPFWRILIAAAIMVIMLAFQYHEVYSASLLYGNKAGLINFSEMIRVNRRAIEAGKLVFSRWYQYRLILATSITYFGIFAFFVNLLSVKRESLLATVKYLIFVPLLLPYIILSGGRGGILELMLYTLTVGTILYEKKHGFTLSARVKMIITFFACGMACFVLFLGLGFVTGKVSFGGRSPLIILAHYGGLSMPALSVILDHVQVENTLIGSHTLVGVYSNLNSLGIHLPKVIAFFPFVKFGDIDTNVYTATYRYILDYGYIGMCILFGILGLFYSATYDYIRFHMKKIYTIPLYAFIVFPLFVATNDEFFLSTLLNTAIIYKYVTFGLVYVFLTFRFSSKVNNTKGSF